MRKLLVAIGIAVGIGSLCYAAQPRSSGSISATKIVIGSKTLAQINALTPDAFGQMVACSDCTQTTVCISSGTGRGGFVLLVSTGGFVGATWGGMPHCQ
jgi:hypothetical protein